jgi:hypothetical protein
LCVLQCQLHLLNITANRGIRNGPQLACTRPDFCGLRRERRTQLIYTDREVRRCQHTEHLAEDNNLEQPACRTAIPSASSTLFPNPILQGSPSFPRPPHQPRQRRLPPHILRIGRRHRHSTIPPCQPPGYFLVDARCRKPSATPDSRNSQKGK